jgi:hypothetical protein
MQDAKGFLDCLCPGLFVGIKWYLFTIQQLLYVWEI